MKPPTLNDVARKAGVSKSTASIILSNRPEAGSYHHATRTRILKAAEDLNYRPNFFATQLRATQRKLIMLCMSRLQNLHASRIAEAFEARITQEGYRLIVTGLQNKKKPEEFTFEILGRQSIAALAVVGEATRLYLPDDEVIRFAEQGVHIVLIGRKVDHPKVTSLVVQESVGERQALEHFQAQGVRRLWLLLPSAVDGPFAERERMVHEAVASMPEMTLEVVRADPPTVDGAYHTMRERLQRHEPPQGVFAVTDFLAYVSMRALAEKGLTIGRDVAVIGFDDAQPSAYMVPPLTTVALPMDAMGTRGAEVMLDLHQGRAQPGDQICFTPELIPRASSGFRPALR